jgi:hypothetical protein
MRCYLGLHVAVGFFSSRSVSMLLTFRIWVCRSNHCQACMLLCRKLVAKALTNTDNGACRLASVRKEDGHHLVQPSHNSEDSGA